MPRASFHADMCRRSIRADVSRPGASARVQTIWRNSQPHVEEPDVDRSPRCRRAPAGKSAARCRRFERRDEVRSKRSDPAINSANHGNRPPHDGPPQVVAHPVWRRFWRRRVARAEAGVTVASLKRTALHRRLLTERLPL